MGTYKTKIVNYGYKEKVIVYNNPIIIGESINTDIERQKYQDMDTDKQKFIVLFHCYQNSFLMLFLLEE